MRIFPAVLGVAFNDLPPAVRNSHESPLPARFAGRAHVTRGRGMQAALVATLFRFPKSSADVEVVVTKRAIEGGERWERRFGASVFHSTLRRANGGMTEQFGLFRFGLGLRVEDRALHYPVCSGRVLGVPIPRFLLPTSMAVEREEDGRFTFDVRLIAPTGALLIHYRGWLVPDELEHHVEHDK